MHSRWHSNPMRSDSHVSLIDSQRRLSMLLHMMDSTENHTLGEQIRRGRYGLGDRRSFEALKQFSGIDPSTREIIADRFVFILIVHVLEYFKIQYTCLVDVLLCIGNVDVETLSMFHSRSIHWALIISHDSILKLTNLWMSQTKEAFTTILCG